MEALVGLFGGHDDHGSGRKPESGRKMLETNAGGLAEMGRSAESIREYLIFDSISFLGFRGIVRFIVEFYRKDNIL